MRATDWLILAALIRRSQRRRRARREARRQPQPVLYLAPWQVSARFPYEQIPPPPSPRKGRNR